MNKRLCLLLLCCGSFAFAQKNVKTVQVTGHSVHIVGESFEGVIFSETYFQRPDDKEEIKKKRYTPSVDDIISLEVILQNQITDKSNKGDRKIIFSRLKKYRRQYIGYLNDKGEKMIYVNCFPVDEDWAEKKLKDVRNIPTWYNTLFEVLDGGNSFWQAHINLATKKIIGMTVNGVA